MEDRLRMMKEMQETREKKRPPYDQVEPGKHGTSIISLYNRVYCYTAGHLIRRLSDHRW